jgi:nitrate reductase gamma subunit
MLNDIHLVPDTYIDPSTSATWKSQPQHFSLSCHEQQQQKCLRLVSLKFHGGVVQITVLQGYGAATVMLPRNLLPSSSGVWRSKKNIRRGKV